MLFLGHSNTFNFRLISALLTCLLMTVHLTSSSVLAQDSSFLQPTERSEVPQKGLLASLMRVPGVGSYETQLPPDIDVGPGDMHPVTASIQELGNNRLLVSVKNNDQHQGYRLSLRLTQFNDQGSLAGSTPFSMILSAGESETKEFTQRGRQRAQLFLDSWSATSKR